MNFPLILAGLLLVLAAVLLMDSIRLTIRRHKASEQGAEQVSDKLHSGSSKSQNGRNHG